MFLFEVSFHVRCLLLDVCDVTRDNDVDGLLALLQFSSPQQWPDCIPAIEDSPIHTACASNKFDVGRHCTTPHAKVLEILIHAGASMISRCRTGWTALHVASLAGAVECVEVGWSFLSYLKQQMLIQHGAPADSRDEEGGLPRILICLRKGALPAHKAASLNHEGVLSTLIRHGCSITVPDECVFCRDFQNCSLSQLWQYAPSHGRPARLLSCGCLHSSVIIAYVSHVL
jgi:ankyrin repeat protein